MVVNGMLGKVLKELKERKSN